MESIWRGISDEKLEDAQHKLLEQSGLTEDEFKSYPVSFSFSQIDWKEDGIQIEEINSHSTEEYIWTYEFGDESNPHLVIIHGYGASGMIFYQLFKKLRKRYHVYLLDLLGQGRSSRPNFECKTDTECENFFINSIEKWRNTIELKDFNLIGHSFGGFISSRYALKYPECINKLILWSPLGAEKAPDNYEKNKINDHIDDLSWFSKVSIKTFKYMYNKNFTPFEGMRKLGRVAGGIVFKKFIKHRFVNLSQIDFDLIYNYLFQIMMRKGSSEYALNIMFENIIVTKKPIISALDELKSKLIDVSFFYGTYDWVNTTLNEYYVSQQLEDVGAKVYIIEDSDHHMYFDNPKQLLKYLKLECSSKNDIKHKI